MHKGEERGPQSGTDPEKECMWLADYRECVLMQLSVWLFQNEVTGSRPYLIN